MTTARVQHLFFVGTAVLCVLGAASVHAAVGKQQPEWQRSSSIDVSAFRYQFVVPDATGSAVPAVVEVPIVGVTVENQGAVVRDTHGGEFPALYVRHATTQPVPYSVSVVGGATSAPELTDHQLDTDVTVPFVEGRENTVTLTITPASSEPLTASAVRLALARNVALPRTVRVLAVTLDGQQQVVVATRQLNDTTVSFPETTARSFMVTCELAQPLRLAELSVVENLQATERDAVRFLAQPGTSYTVYIDPDRPYGLPSVESGNLARDEGVQVLGEVTPLSHPGYRAADTDHDGFSDLRDNCVSVANLDQTDVDRNGRGDVCDDFDRDGMMNGQDNCVNVPNGDQADTDHDKIGDACDMFENRFTERNPWVPWAGMGIAVTVLVGLLVSVVRLRPGVGQVSSQGALGTHHPSDDVR